METPVTRTPGPPDAVVTPCPLEAVVTPGTPNDVMVTPHPVEAPLVPALTSGYESDLTSVDDPRPPPGSAYELIKTALNSTDSDMEEFEDVIFDHFDQDGRFRKLNVKSTPFVTFNDVIGEWGVMGIDVSNTEMLEHLEKATNYTPPNNIPFFVPTPISQNYCSHQRDSKGPTKCPCLMYEKTSTKKFVLTTELYNDLELIRQEICCAQQLGHDQLDEYRSHKAVILALTTLDKNIKYVENHPHSLRRLYAIRTLYGLDKDFGQRYTVLGEFSAQFDAAWLNSLIDIVTGALGTAMRTVKDFVKCVFEKISNVFNNFFQLFSEKVSTLMSTIMNKIYDYVWNQFSPLEFIKSGWNNCDTRKAIVIISVFFAVILIDILGFVTMRVTVAFCRRIEQMFNKKVDSTPTMDTYYAQSPEIVSPLTSILTVAGMLLGVCKSDISMLAKRARDILCLLNLGKSTAAFAGALLIVAPSCIKDLVAVVTQPSQVRERMLIESWLTRAHAVIALSKISRVIVSDRFAEWLNELYASGRDLRNKLTDPVSRNLMSVGFNQILKLKTLVASFKDGAKTRRTPHSVHIAGPPGIAKTLIARRLIRDIYENPDVYIRSISDEYWSGFTNQNFILIDEFLAATPDTNKMLGEEYLTLVSPCIFKPPLPSIDDPSLGLKGTTVNPRGVLTINNHKYSVVSGLDRDAVWRRREFVVEVKPHPDFPFNNSRVDFANMSEEQIGRVAWLLFDIYPSTPYDRNTRDANALLTDLTYAELVAFWRDSLTAFETLGDNVNRALGEQENLDLDIDTLLEDEMRNMYNIPNQPQSVKEAVVRLLAELPFSFGNNANPEPPVYEDQAPPFPFAPSEAKNRPNDITRTERTSAALRKNRNKWRKWKDEHVRGIRNGTLERERETELLNKIREGYTIAWLGEAFHAEQREWIESVIDFEQEYFSTPEILDPPDQREFLADLAHTNVDCTTPHRHQCTVCARQYAHQHPVAWINHPIVCSDCTGYNERLTSGTLVKASPTEPTIHYDRSYLLPEDLFLRAEMYELSDEDLEALRKRISKAFILNYYDAFINDRSIFSESPVGTLKNTFITSVGSSIATGVMFYLIFLGVRSLFKLIVGEKTEEDEVYFVQSPHRENHQPTRPTRPRRFQQYRQQSGALAYVKIEIRGVEVVAFPLTRHTMMTYEHAFALLSLDKDASEPIIFNYGGSRETHQLRSLQIISEPSADLLFITLPRSTRLNSFPNNVSRFWSDFDVKGFESCAGVLETLEQTHAVRLRMIGPRTYASATRKRTLDQALGYQAHTKKGDCGSILIATMGPLAGRYLGLHVAGGEGPGGFFGMSTIVTRETIEEALNFKGVEVPELIDFSTQGVDFYGPNLIRIETIPRDEVVHLSRKSKLKPSAISSFLPWKPKKHLPIMDATDPRCDGEDPVVNMLNDTLNVSQPEVDSRNLKIVLDDMKHFYRFKLKWPIGKRLLTIEEAVGGIPGLLSSMKVNSSAGYPLVRFSKKRGKRDWFYFDEEGNLVINDVFREMVHQFRLKLFDPTVSPEMIEGRFLTFLKDELTTQKKINEKRCRLIFGGDLIANTAFRMLFGSFIVAIQTSYRTTPSAIGLNQYSYDMELIYQYLSEVGENFIAGDFKNFDKRMVKQFQLAGYELISSLCDFVPKHVQDKFIYHQTESPLQIFNKKLYLRSSHFSGCFFTTILNVFVHEAYIRYVFRNLCPGKVFEEHMRLKILGDDHIYSVSDEVKDKVTPLTIAHQLELIGQTYTSDDKECELTHAHRPFDKLTFLGAHPIDYAGQYVGALKKDTLFESILWTRNDDNTLLQECKTAMEMMSVWGEEDYTEYYETVNNALTYAGYDPIDMPSQTTMIDIVANRTAASENSFPYVLVAQGDDSMRTDFGLTKLNQRHTLDSTVLNTSTVKENLASKAIAETPVDLGFSTDSNVWRDDFTWTSAQPAGTSIYTIDVPFGLLNLGEQDNIQNMPFERYSYWTGDVEVSLQINGQPFQQGLLAMYFMPLCAYESELANITTTNHVLLTPGESSTASIHIPFIYPRSLMNTYASATESLGTIYVTPLAPLQSVAGETLNVSVFSRFPNSHFRIPKISEASLKKKKLMWATPSGTQRTTTYKGDFLKTRISRRDMDEEVEYEAQGAGQSTTVTNNYNNVGGTMPIQDNPISIGQDLGQQVEADLKADVSAMPLDNPPLCSGSIPVHQTFSGMSASHGVRPTNDMQLFPSALAREHMKIFNDVESKISTLLGKKCLLTTFEVSTSDPIGKLLYSVSLNTRMGLIEGAGIPFNVALLNQFIFWKSHLRFEVVAARTRFHSTRLNAVVTYGAPISSESLRTVAFSHMIDFSGENSKFDFDIEWNAQTEFLRTYEGDDQVDPVQNYSLGNLSFYLTNSLVAPESVENSHQVLVFLRFVEPVVAVPRPFSPFTFNAYSEIIPDFILMTITSGTSVPLIEAQSPGSYSSVLLSKALMSFDPIVPPTGSFPAGGSITITIRSVLGVIIGTFVRSVQSITTTATEVTLSFSPAYTIGTAGSSSESSTAFESITILDALARKDKVKMYAQGPDIPPSNEDGTQAQDESVEATPTTHDAIADRQIFPCKLEIGRKFEFAVSDIHEIGRRYHRVKLVGNGDLDQFAVNSYLTEDGEVTTFVNFSVQVQSYLRAFFAVWAGSVKYRIFNLDDNVGNIVFAPFLNTNNRICVPIIDALNGNAFTYDGQALTSFSSVSAPMARERLYPVAFKQFIDVSAPFQTHFNFCYNSKTQNIAPIASGTMALSYGGSEPEIYTAFGDDLRLGVYRPPQNTKLNLAGFKNGVAGFFDPVALKTVKHHFTGNPIPGVDLAKAEPPVNVNTGAQG